MATPDMQTLTRAISLIGFFVSYSLVAVLLESIIFGTRFYYLQSSARSLKIDSIFLRNIHPARDLSYGGHRVSPHRCYDTRVFQADVRDKAIAQLDDSEEGRAPLHVRGDVRSSGGALCHQPVVPLRRQQAV